MRAHYFVQGKKSQGWREAQVLKVGVHMHFGKADMGPGTFGVLLQFGFGNESTRKWVARQVVPPTWILSGVEDASVASALRESGILDEQQAFWGLLLPETEMQAIARLEGCQRKALYTVRAQATKLHDEALPRVRERFQKLGYGDEMLGTVLDWIQDLAPVVVHLHLDKMGAFMEIDEFYRSQFETKTSCGALDPQNLTRQNWEKELFGGAYDDAKPFDRCKYGALSVMNDYRGVIPARQYGDSYLVLKDVRLRCTFASTDSGGISGSRLAVLDKYAHVLSEYNDNELHGAAAGRSFGSRAMFDYDQLEEELSGKPSSTPFPPEAPRVILEPLAPPPEPEETEAAESAAPDPALRLEPMAHSLPMRAGAKLPVVPPVRGAQLPADESLFMWMSQKFHLGQDPGSDMFLLGDPGPHLRAMALHFAAAMGREVEYIGITRDTTEADLKQRREILEGQLVFFNAPAVEAALHGRVLILEGMQKAERNVLPLLNNLLENREMSLEDGSFLMAPGREEDISLAAEGGRCLLPVSKDFLVIAIGLPVPKYPGTALDPPLRSRFAARTVKGDNAFSLPEAQAAEAGKLMETVRLWRAAGLPRFPEFGLLSVLRLLKLFPQLPQALALQSAYPWTVLALSPTQRQQLQWVLKTQSLELERQAYSFKAAELQDLWAELRFELGAEVTRVECPCGSWPSRTEAVLASLAVSQRSVLARMLQDHCAGMDICLVGERGVGKTALCRAFAEVLGYRSYSVFCFKDMTSRDLTLRRGTDDRGNTIWQASPLMKAALEGGLAILDGVHRLAAGALSGAIGRLLCDRAATLADGTKLVPEAQWRRWRRTWTEAELLAQGFRAVSKAFRVVATAEPPQEEKNWLDDELLTLFHFTEVKPVPGSQQLQLVARLCQLTPEEPLLQGLVAYGKALRAAAKSDAALQPLLLSLRQLLQAGRRLSARPNESQEVVRAALTAYVDFLPPLSKQSVLRMMREAMKGVGLQVDLDNPEESKEARRRAQLAEERGERLKALEEPAIGLRFGRDKRAEQLIQEETATLREESGRERQRQREELLKAARGGSSASGGARGAARLALELTEEELCLGGVRCPRHRPARPELVPKTVFVDIPQHLTILRSMLVDWMLQQHLLLIGNQGVGKNKLADRFLGMLRLEREYVQLHRDTSVQSLTLQPMLQNGVVVYQDSPLVSAVRHGRVLVIDEADKAPLEVVCILKSLAEDGEFSLGDGRTIMKKERIPQFVEDPKLLPIADGFRMIVLANRPGYPFLGNDFYRECGDVFASFAIDNPDVASEVELLRSYGPSVPKETLARLLALFAELRRLVAEGLLAYPYSTRELVRIVRHLDSFPDDPVEEVFADVFEFDWHDDKLRETLMEVLHSCGFKLDPPGAKAVKHGDAKKRLPKDFKSAKHYDSGEMAENDGEGFNPGDVGTKNYDDQTDRSGKRHAPRAGNWDGRQHIGEGPWDGGSGGTGTAGIGGRAGPYRLDVGQELVMLSEDQKTEVPEEWHKKAQQMADEAYANRLRELKMSAHDEQEYRRLREAVAAQIAAFRLVLQSHEAKERERSWQKQQQHGELDEMRLVDGIAGARNIYRRRGEAEHQGGDQVLPKRVKFVMDCSGSMYTFNRIDQRLQRLMEAAIFIFESFKGFEQKYEYAMVGHSGSGAEAESFVAWGKPPSEPKEQLAIVQQMAAHAQYSHSGDHTLQATDRAIKDVLRKPADEHYVFVVSDADLARYGISPASWNKILMQDKRVNAYVILISSNTDEAETIKSGLTPGHGFVCEHNDLLAVTFKQAGAGRLVAQNAASDDAGVRARYLVILVASNAKAGSGKGVVRPELLRGGTEDPCMDWITMGYPKLAQSSGKYYFEVNLVKGAEAPQVGLLSKDFKLQPGAPSTQGVGDCKHGWSVDGQSSIRWHGGEALPWGQTWESQEGTRKLNKDVTIGVAVDLDNRALYFSTDGQWDEKAMEFPAFGKETALSQAANCSPPSPSKVGPPSTSARTGSSSRPLGRARRPSTSGDWHRPVFTAWTCRTSATPRC
ncbi:unnamed protein product [Effrenium voratum]|uniref:B30.2/SPRY domain-containing protein n=1 Tax=Effrenium voratum TaxID=2562239 RepID=A0AA36I4M5_9DINO|nr:unnamed protein product [Effrenium voratum]